MTIQLITITKITITTSIYKTQQLITFNNLLL